MTHKANNERLLSIKLKITPLNLIMSVAIMALAIRYVPPIIDTNVEVDGNVVTLSTDVNDQSMKNYINAVRGVNNDSVILRLETPGGSVLAGQNFINQLKREGKHVITFSDTLNASMGTSIFMSGDERVVTKNVMYLIHRGSIGNLTYNEIKLKLADLKEKLEERKKYEAIKKQEGALDDELDVKARAVERKKRLKAIEEAENGIKGNKKVSAVTPQQELLLPLPLETGNFVSNIPDRKPIPEPMDASSSPFSSSKTSVQLEGDIESYQSMLDIKEASGKQYIERLKEIRKTAPKPEVTDRLIEEFIKGDRDIIVSADDLLASGIATRIVDDITDLVGVQNEKKILGIW